MIERLLKCKLCGEKVSSAAIRCPHCGTPNFKTNTLLREEASARENVLLQQRVDICKGYLAKDGYFPVDNLSDAALRLYFPDTAKVSLEKHVLSPNVPLDRRDVFVIRLDGRPIHWDHWLPTVDNDYRKNNINVIRTGAHQITFQVGTETKTFEIHIHRSSSRIVLKYGLAKSYWSGKLSLRDASAYVE